MENKNCSILHVVHVHDADVKPPLTGFLMRSPSMIGTLNAQQGPKWLPVSVTRMLTELLLINLMALKEE